MPGADKLPLTLYLHQPAQQELPEASALLDLTQHWLHGLHPQGITLLTLVGPQVTVHPLYQQKVLGDTAVGNQRNGTLFEPYTYG